MQHRLGQLPPSHLQDFFGCKDYVRVSLDSRDVEFRNFSLGANLGGALWREPQYFAMPRIIYTQDFRLELH